MLLGEGGVVISVSLQRTLCIGLSGLLVSERLRVLGALLSGGGHHLLVVRLRILLLSLRNRHFLVEVLHEKVHHRDDAASFLSLLLVRAHGLWRRWRRRNAVGGDSRKNRD